MFADMPLGLTMHNKWENINMTAPLHSLRMERPAYSTPAPVENTPSNNECRMVELRGAKIASFIVGGDEYICLPQAFDLFLKHLVGGLHTVYTKLKRLSIAPVVCNVEQVRILRGIGAIQPGVNRCKLITRKDFETLYQDCTTATRPGRPPKRYPMLPPTTDYLSSHNSVRNGSGSHGLMNSPDFSSLHKRMRLDSVEKQMHAFHDHRRASCSPPSGGDGINSDKEMVLGNSSDLHNNATANFFLQAQALRQQYQQAASGLHNGLDAQHAAAAAAGINPALAPFMMMSHPSLFSGALPPSSLNMINHVNQLAQGHNAASMTSAAAAAVAQMANRSSGNYQAAAAQAAAQVAASFAAAQEVNETNTNRADPEPATEERDSDVELKQSSQSNMTGQPILTNGIGSDGRASPESSLSDGTASHLSEHSENALSLKSDSGESAKDASKVENNDDDNVGSNAHDFETRGDAGNDERNTADADENFEDRFMQQNPPIDPTFPLNPNNQSSMQTLLTNIQGLLKVAADNARLQEKHKSFEIAELKMRLGKERQLRGELEKKIQHISKSRDDAIRKYKKEVKSRKNVQEQYAAFRSKYHKENAPEKVGLGASSPPPPSDAESIKSGNHDITGSPTPNKQYAVHNGSPAGRAETIDFTPVTEQDNNNSEARVSPINFQHTPVTAKLSYVDENTNNNNRSASTSSRSSLDQGSDGALSRNSSSHESPCAVSMDGHDRRSADHLPLADSRIPTVVPEDRYPVPILLRGDVVQQK